MRRVKVIGIGAYYKSRSDIAGPNASPMRGLVCLVKQNSPDGQPRPNTLAHPLHPGGKPVRLTTWAAARLYVAEIICSEETAIRRSLGIGNKPITLVPLPSSNVTEAQTRGRWPARDLGTELAKHGFGQMAICVVNRKATSPKHAGSRVRGSALADNMRKVQEPPSNQAIVYLDDLITWGDHVAALDNALGQPAVSGALTVAITVGVAGVDSYTMQQRTVFYDSAGPGWSAGIS